MEITDHTIQPHIKTLEPNRKKDVLEIIDMMQTLFGFPPKLWGSIIGFGQVKYQYATGHKGIMPILSLASRKNAITLYLSYDLSRYDLEKLGSVSSGKGCLYIKKLQDINKEALMNLLKEAKKEILNSGVIKEIIEN